MINPSGASPSPPASSSRKRILLVDDNKTFQTIFRAALAPENFELHICNTGKDALEIVARQYFDFICASYYLPDMDSIELCWHVRRLTHNASKPFVLLTSVDNPGAMVMALPRGVTDIFMRKDVEQLLAFIRRFPNSQELLQGRILYVEDSKSQRLRLKSVLEAKGLQVDAFANADEALLSFQNKDYDLVLTDIVLDGTMSGLAFVNRIRRQIDDKGDVPIIALTAFNDQTRRLELLSLGVSDYIRKPVAEEELLVRIKGLLTQQRLLRQIDAENRMRHEEALSRSDARFQMLFTNMTDGVVMSELIVGTNGRPENYRLLEANPAFEALTGLNREEIAGRLATDAYRIDEAPFLDRYAQVIETRSPDTFEYEFVPTGKYFRVRAIAMHDRHFATILEDITKNRQEEIRRLQAERDLRMALRQVEQKERAQTRFLFATGHDLRQPLYAAQLFADSLAATKLDRKQQAEIDKVRQSLTAMSNQLQVLLDLSRLESSDLQPSPDHISTRDLFDQLAGQFSSLAGKACVRLVFHAGDFELYTDNGLFARLLGNLVDNAIKFSPRGTVLVCARRTRQGHLIQVRDNGGGIPESLQSAIFDDFFQVDNTARDPSAGYGLGLSIVNRIAHLLNVQIRVRSALGRGSIFSVFLADAQ